MSALGAIQGRPRRLANIAARNKERRREIRIKEEILIETAMAWMESFDPLGSADRALLDACEALRLARIGRTRGPKKAEQ